MEPKLRRSNRIGHGDIDHAILAKEHSMNRCSNVSIPPSHKGHWSESTWNLFPNSDLVGSKPQANFQRNSLSLSVIFNFHIDNHSDLVKGPKFSNLWIFVVQKANLVEKLPLLLGLHISLSAMQYSPSWIFLINLIDSSSKVCCSNSKFHLLGFSWINFETQWMFCSSITLREGLKSLELGTHGAFHTAKPILVLTLQQTPFFNVSLVDRIDRQTHEASCLTFTLQKDWPRKYLATTYCTQGLSSLFATYHPSFAKRALFMSPLLWIPRPPTLLGTHIESQALR